ncbi:V-type proton ATPase subunit H-like [Stegodyphus dumicola]|uniref:V-type proton ATPase subunit H-like n=1 Tax=Stegodyphus dumicola TaxID=202533 RepID=UPI0015AEB6F1|nr:V-type proton ATPase subunit H-like [Stegodyphus dumicola]
METFLFCLRMSSENDEKRLRDQRGTQTSPTPSEEELMLAFTALPSNIEQKVLDLTGLIQAKAKQLRSKPQVSWLPYLESGLISSQDYAFITAFQHSQTKEERDKLLNYFKGRVFDSLVRIVHRVCLVEEIQKFLVLIDDMLWEDTTRVSRFKPEEMEPWKAFLDLLSCSDDFVRNMASRIISKFITYDESKPSLEDLNYYFSWLNHELQQGNIYLQSVARCLQLLLSRDQYRVPFMKLNGIHKIIRLLSMGVKPQDQYQLCFCLWVTSFNPYAAERINRS